MGQPSRSQASRAFSLESCIANLLNPSLERLIKLCEILPHDFSVQQIHQSRILIRTVNAHLDTFGPLLRSRATKQVRTQLSWFDSSLAQLRNTDVILETLPLNLTPAALHNNDEDQFKIDLTNYLMARRDEQARKLCEELKSQRAESLVCAMGGLVSAVPVRRKVQLQSPEQQLALVLHCVSRAHTKLLKLAKKSRESPSQKYLHQVRIQAKHVRYSSHALQSQGLVVKKSTFKLADRLHPLLGRNQDLAMLESLLESQENLSVSEERLRMQWLKHLRRESKKILRQYLHLVQKDLARR